MDSFVDDDTVCNGEKIVKVFCVSFGDTFGSWAVTLGMGNPQWSRSKEENGNCSGRGS
jgi:hypothetical protein